MKIFGKNTVIERMRAFPRSVRKVYIAQGHTDASYFFQKARQWGIPIYSFDKNKMLKLTRNINAQGILAEVDDFAYTPFDDLMEFAVKKKTTLVFLDNLTDPQNLGSILRTLSCLGGFAVVLPKKESVDITAAVSRVACGGENYVPVAKVSNLGQAITKAKALGYWIAGAMAEAGDDIYTMTFSFPLALVIGSEHKGIRQGIEKHLDIMITIPMKNARLSFNAAQAAAMICYEITKQKK